VLPSGQQQTKGDEWCTRGDGSRIGFAANTEGANNTLYLDDLLDGTTTHVFYTYDTSTNYANWVLYVGNFRIVDPTTGEQIAPPPAVEEDSSEVESSEEEVLVPLVWNAVNNTATLVRADTSYGATTLNIEIVNASNVPVTYTGAGTKFYKIVGTSLYGNKIFFNADYEESYYDAYRGNGYIVTYDYLLYTNGVTHPTYVLSSGNQQMDWDVWRTRGNGSELRTWTSASGTAGEYNTYYLDDLLDDPTLMYFYTYDERSTGYTLYVGNFRIVDPTTGEDVLVPGESGEVTPPVEESSDVVESSSEVIESSEVVESSETTTIREWAWHDINEEATDAIYYCNNQDKSDVWGEVKYVSAIGGRTGVYRVWAATCYEQVCGMVALPKYEKSYYENLVALDASATLEIDFYYEEGSFVHTQKNGTYNAGGSSAFTANTWHTISIPFSTILTNWDYITGATAASSSTKLILFGTYGATAPFVYYLDGFRIVTTAEEPEVEVSVEESSSQEEVPVPDWTEYGVNDGNVNVWTASGSEKFIQGVDYSDRYANTTLKLAAFQNEKESAQIIMTPSVAVEYYYLIPSTLSTARGNLLNVSNIEIYHQKYMQITTIKSSNWPEGPGWYPDALLPQDAAVRYEENTIALGMNKGIWITFDIPEQQEAGVYTGTFELVVDEQSYLVPVELTVYNYAVSEEQKLINALSLNYSDVANFEGYASAQELPVEIKEAYYEFLLDNGGSRPGGLPYEWNSSYGVVYGSATYDPSRLFEEGYEVNVQYHEIKIRNYIECIAKYAEDPRVAAYPMLIESEAAVNYDGEGNNTNVTNKLALKRVIEEMYQYSMANGVDLFKKVTLYLSWIDEFDGSSVTKRKSAQYNLAYMDTFFQEAATYLAGKADEYPLGAGVSESFRAEVLDSLSKIYIVCTAMGVTMLDPETQSMVFCPTIDKYHTEAGREAVDAWAEATGIGVKWAYLADNPQPPYSTYHIDDYLISSRMYNWMLYEYDISGTLYWGTVLSWDASLGQDYVVDDFYANPLRYPTANGDGFLMYPGNVYGVSGPVGSVRLQSIRDGMEDYNLLYDLEEFMKDRAADKGVDYNGDSFNTILRSLVDTLYRGTTCTYTSTYVNDFEATRKALASLLTLASEQGVVVENCQIAGDNAVFTVSAPSTATVEFNGVVTSQTANGITTYTVTLGKDDALSIVSGDYSLTMNAYSEVEVYNTWNDITAEETSNGTIYENARYYVNNGASHTTVNGDNPSTNGPISVVTLTEETAVGGRTEGTYYYIDPVANEVQDHGFMLLPKEEKSFYEETYSDSALLKFDVYFDMHGEYTDGMRLYTLLGQVGNQQKTSREWYTFEIDLDVIFEYWDTFHNPTSSDGLRRIALFGISGTRGSVVGEIFFYIGNFRIEQ
ncbi:MAG: DUF4091 domain-containing protein, partial [Clostridia bacterium]|nr:DUF4091 domain-containing protein [Clostridia bacterium]